MIWLLVGLAAVIGTSWTLSGGAPVAQILGRSGLPLLGLILLWRYLDSHRSHNRQDQGGDLLGHLGLGNHLSILRGVELIILSIFLFTPQPTGWVSWIPAALYTSADILDYLDGYAARVRGEETLLGEELDQLFDGAGLLIATVIAIRYGKLTWWFFPFGAARYLFVAGIRIRRQLGLPVHPLPESRSRRPIAGLSMGFMSAMLWPIAKPPMTILAGLFFLVPFGGSFLRDWFVVSGALDPQSRAYLRFRRGLETALIRYLPTVVRLVLGVLLAWEGWNLFVSFESQVGAFSAAGLPVPAVVVAVFAGIQLLAAPLILLGFAGRFVAFMLLFPIGIIIMSVSNNNLRSLLLVCDLLVLLLGTGTLSLYKPSEVVFSRRAGERR